MILQRISCITAPHTQQVSRTGATGMAGIVRSMPAGTQWFRHRAAPAQGPVVLATLLLLGCAAPPPRPDAPAHLVSGVPFIAQEAYQCGPASLAMVLGHLGTSVDAEAIGRALYLPSVRGALNLELELYARRLGFWTRAFTGTLDTAREELARGRPLIVFQDLGRPPLVSQPHFAVLVGFDDRAGEVVLHSGTTPYLRVGYAEFERTWAARRHWTLLVLPP